LLFIDVHLLSSVLKSRSVVKQPSRHKWTWIFTGFNCFLLLAIGINLFSFVLKRGQTRIQPVINLVFSLIFMGFHCFSIFHCFLLAFIGLLWFWMAVNKHRNIGKRCLLIVGYCFFTNFRWFWSAVEKHSFWHK